MFIAHAPAGYITATYLLKRFQEREVDARKFFLAAMVGAVMPDIDFLYFYLIDHQRHHHHTYFTHYPVVWIAGVLVTLCWLRVSQASKTAPLALVFFLGGFSHMILDSIVGDIWWFAPLIDKPYSLFHVSAVCKPWWMSFIVHWSFALEILLCIWALHLYKTRSNHGSLSE